MEKENKKDFIVVLGGGESGAGAAVLAKTKGFDVLLSDSSKIPEKYKALLDRYHIEYEEGQHSEQRILTAKEVIKSPGIPLDTPLLKKILEKGIPVISEIEFAGRYTTAKMVCITGSNGKTTTTLLTYHILRKAGLNVGLAGNVGKSLALQVATENYDIYVIELSSFQLDNMYDFKADIAVLLNITPDHLDRYDHKMQNYTAAKFRILQNQTKDDYFIYWESDPIIRKEVEKLPIGATKMPFNETKLPDSAAYLQNGRLHFHTPGKEWEIDRSRLSLSGLHNLYNSMAAGLSASLLNVDEQVIKNALEDFESVEHRLEFVERIDGVTYINDSKATNVNSTWYALESMTSPTILILGGKDKGNDYSEIEPFVKEKVKAIVCMGVDNSKLLNFFNGKVSRLEDTHSIEEAVEKCAELAQDGDTVLLSPCCASFDLFKSYEDRGRQFKNCVRNLKQKI